MPSSSETHKRRACCFFREELMRQTRVDNIMSACSNGHLQNGPSPPAPSANVSEFKSSNNLWWDMFGAADQVGF